MAKIKCSICRIIVPLGENRSAHLRIAHRIDSRYKGAVRDYFEEA